LRDSRLTGVLFEDSIIAWKCPLKVLREEEEGGSGSDEDLHVKHKTSPEHGLKLADSSVTRYLSSLLEDTSQKFK
jgi:hypothetical protein